MNIGSDMAVSVNWGTFKKGFRTPLKGFQADIKQGKS